MKNLILPLFAFILFACNESEPKPDPIAIDLQANAVKVFGQSTGSVTATVTGGVEPYTYSWSNGSTTKDIINIQAGNYDLTVTDATKVTATASAEITQPTEMVVTCTKKNATASDKENGSISISVTGGIEPYSYSWNNGLTVAEATDLAAGQYLIAVKDANEATVNLDITIVYPLKITLSSTNASTYNASNGSIAIATNGGGMPPFTYAWSDASTDGERSSVKAGYYQVTVTDAEEKTATANVTVYENYDNSKPLASLVSKITRYDQSGVRIDNNGQIIYIDPVFLPATVEADADVILITHGHDDHFSPTAINKLKKSTTIFAVPADIYDRTVAIADAARVKKIAPDSVLNIDGTNIEVVKAYNSNHTLPNSVGYILIIDGKKVYHTGDTKRIPEMTGYTCDLVFLPMGQTYTFATLAEAAGAAEDCGADVVIPMHYGMYEGKVSDPWAIKELLKDKAVVCTLAPLK